MGNNPANQWDMLGMYSSNDSVDDLLPKHRNDNGFGGRPRNFQGVPEFLGRDGRWYTPNISATSGDIVMMEPFEVTASRFEKSGSSGSNSIFSANFNPFYIFGPQLTIGRTVNHRGTGYLIVGSDGGGTFNALQIISQSQLPSSVEVNIDAPNNTEPNGGGINGYTATDLLNGTVGLAGAVATNSATSLQAAGQFAMDGNVYRQGFYGNQYVSSSSVSAAKASQEMAARIGENIGRGTAIVGGALAVREVYDGGASNHSLARGYVADAMTTIAFFGGPFGAGAALLYGVGDAFGAFNWIYDEYSNSRRFGGPP